MSQKKPKGTPKEQQELVRKIHHLLQERGYTFWDAQTVTSLTLAATKVQDPALALRTAADIAELMLSTKGIDAVMFYPVLQKLSEGINAAVNNTSLSDITIE